MVSLKEQTKFEQKIYNRRRKWERMTVGIYKSLTDACKWKLGLRPRYSFSGNICFEISVFCLCSEAYNNSITMLRNEKKDNRNKLLARKWLESKKSFKKLYMK
jgi:hypothetical protein